MSIIKIVGIFIILQIVFMVLYTIPKSKKLRERIKQSLEKNKARLNDPNVVKMALWINIDSINGVPYDESTEIQTKMKNGLFNTVSIGLFDPGKYTFVVSSNSREEYKNIKMEIELQSGVFYQLGCNEGGPYLVPDPDPERYLMSIKQA